MIWGIAMNLPTPPARFEVCGAGFEVWAAQEAPNSEVPVQGDRPETRLSELGVKAASRSWRLVGLLALGIWANAQAQNQPVDTRRPLATREELEALKARLKPDQRVYAEAVALQERLTNGDFKVGDRIWLVVEGEKELSDSLTVTENVSLQLPGMPDVSLRGVLRSELEDHIRKVLSQFIREPVVHATPLIRLSVLGQVARPGFISVPAMALVSDVVTAAGGLTPNSDLGKTQVVRGGQVIMPAASVDRAIASGATLDRLNLHSGDQLVIGERKHTNTMAYVGGVSAILGLVLTITLLTRGH